MCSAPFSRYAKAFGIGFAVLAKVPLAAILLFISNVGVRLALIVLFLYAAAIIALNVPGFFLGALLWRGATKKAPCYYAELRHRYPRLAHRGQCARPVLCGGPRLRAARSRRFDAPARQGRGEAVAQGRKTACEESAASDPAVLLEDSDSASNKAHIAQAKETAPAVSF